MLNNPDEDIRESERRLIQKELFLLEDQKEEAEKRFQAMFENALVGLFRGDVAKRLLTDANYEAALTFGFDSVEALILHMNADKETYNFFKTMPGPPQLTDGTPYSFSSRAQRRRGTPERCVPSAWGRDALGRPPTRFRFRRRRPRRLPPASPATAQFPLA